MTNDDEIEQDDPYAEFYERPVRTIGSDTEQMFYLQLDVRARELALDKAVQVHTTMSAISHPDGSRIEPNVLFLARAFYDFLTGESDPNLTDPTEQSQ